MEAMLRMRKLDIRELERAAAGEMVTKWPTRARPWQNLPTDGHGASAAQR